MARPRETDQLAGSIAAEPKPSEPPRQAIVLRDYQEDAVAEIRARMADGKRKVLLCSPTGSGKTIIFTFVARSVLDRGRRALIVGHRQEIIDQISAALTAMGVEHGLIVAGAAGTSHPIQLASIQTLQRRDLSRLSFDLLVLDECHHAVADSWLAILSAWPQVFTLGVSASPQRLDGRGLGDIFDTMVRGPDVAELIRKRWLVQPTIYAPKTGPDLTGVRTRAGDFAAGDLARAMSGAGLVGDAVEHFRRLCPREQAIAFCCTVEHSRQVAARFNGAGFSAVHVDGTISKPERRRLIGALASGDVQILTNASLFSEGVDVPDIGAIIQLRPTQSLALYLQMAGRALRPASGKSRAVLIDHAGNVFRHGFPDEPRQWSLEGSPRGRKSDTRRQLRRCQSCGAIHPPRTSACAACGTPLQPTPQEIAESEAQLREARRTHIHNELRGMDYKDLLRWADTPEKVQLAARIRHYAPGWVYYRLQELGQ